MAYGYYPRRSIFSGLILIIIGVLFLVYEFHPEFDIGYIFTRYWPLLFIIWGIALLFDHLLASRAGRPGARVSGGEIALIIILLLLVAGFAGYNWVKKAAPGEYIGWGSDGWHDIFAHSYSWDESLPAVAAKPHEVISISTQRGDISVTPSNDSQIHVAVHKTAHGRNQSDARKSAADVHVQISSTANGYEITPQISNDAGSRVDVNLSVRLPSDSAVKAQTAHGDITLSQAAGPVTIVSKSGDVNINNISGDVSVQMQHGDARIALIKGNVQVSGHGDDLDCSGISGDVTLDGDFYGTIRASNIGRTLHYTSSRTNLTLTHLSGNMEMDSGDFTVSDLPGNIQLTTANKDITLENISGRVDLTDTRGDIEITFHQPPRQEIHVTNTSGDIDLTLPADSAFEIAAMSRSGEVDSDFSGAGLRTTNVNNTTGLQGSYGSRGPRIVLNTTYGTITIHKAQ